MLRMDVYKDTLIIAQNANSEIYRDYYLLINGKCVYGDKQSMTHISVDMTNGVVQAIYITHHKKGYLRRPLKHRYDATNPSEVGLTRRTVEWLYRKYLDNKE